MGITARHTASYLLLRHSSEMGTTTSSRRRRQKSTSPKSKTAKRTTPDSKPCKARKPAAKLGIHNLLRHEKLMDDKLRANRASKWRPSPAIFGMPPRTRTA